MRRLLLSLILVTASADARTLYWRALDVEAKLDRDGEMRVSERHRMVFDGEWNGGERRFRIAPGQQLELISLSRIDTAGVAVPLSRTRGSIGLGEYSWDGTLLRWRARRANDPPFRNQELTYVIDYKLRNIIEREGDGYVLDHDFAFADRPGVIETYSVRFDLDPAWQPGPGFTPAWTGENLQPGEGVNLHMPLQWAGEGQPRYIRSPQAAPAPVVAEAAPLPIALSTKAAAVAGFLVIAALIWFWFVRAEGASGRYEPLPPVTRKWLEEHLLTHRAEVVGTAWDSSTGEAEVAALIAIMTGEGKIENQPGAKPRLRLLVPRESLSDYERAFVEKLFIAGDEIDPETLRKHYKATGFDPASAIRGPLSDAAKRLVGSLYGGWLAAGLGCLGVVAMFTMVSWMGAVADPASALGLAFAGLILFAVTMWIALAYRSNPRRGLSAAMALPLIVFAGAVVVQTSVVGMIAPLIANAVMLGFAFFSARWNGTAAELMNLRSFRAAREFLRRRLEEKDPTIEERWIPYILAFGLGPELDKWFVAAQRSWRDVTPLSTPSTPSSTVAAPVFAGAGGRFGGAGATGGWASSISEFAAAVPAPAGGGGGGSSWSSSSSSSSSSSRSSSSGGSRSGGGGGGGW